MLQAMRLALLLVILVACRPDRARELAQCEVIVGEAADSLARCLVRDYDWSADSARRAELHFIAEQNRKRRGVQ